MIIDIENTKVNIRSIRKYSNEELIKALSDISIQIGGWNTYLNTIGHKDSNVNDWTKIVKKLKLVKNKYENEIMFRIGTSRKLKRKKVKRK